MHVEVYVCVCKGSNKVAIVLRRAASRPLAKHFDGNERVRHVN